MLIAVKNPNHAGFCHIHYLGHRRTTSPAKRELAIVDNGQLPTMPWETILPNAAGAWVSQRSGSFTAFPAIGSTEREVGCTVFGTYSSGLKTNRDAWCYCFSRPALKATIASMIEFCNSQVDIYQAAGSPPVDSFIDTDPTKIK